MTIQPYRYNIISLLTFGVNTDLLLNVVNIILVSSKNNIVKLNYIVT